MGNGIAVPKGRYKLPRDAGNVKGDVILVFAEGKLAAEATRAGAHHVGGMELCDAIVSKKLTPAPTVFLSTTAFAKPVAARLGRYLGPLGQMPSERRGTVTDEIGNYIDKLKASYEWKADKTGRIFASIGKMHFPADDIVKNFRHFMDSVKDATGNLQKKGFQPKGSTKPGKYTIFVHCLSDLIASHCD